MKKVLILILAIAVWGTAMAQDSTKTWQTGGKVGVNMSEVGFYNWAKGGDNYLSATSFLNLFANRKINDWAWENTLDLEFGLKQEDGSILKKTDDRIELNSKIGKLAKNKWYYTGFLNFKSQFAKGYDYGTSETVHISDLMSPGYLTFGLGMDYKPNNHFSALIAPLAAKATFVLDQDLADAGSYGVDPAEYQESTGAKIADGNTSRLEMGATVTLAFQKDIFKNVNLNTKLDLFSNYMEDPQNVDVDWQTTITMKVNKYLNAVFKAHLIYDDNTDVAWQKDGEARFGPKTQFKQSLSVGLMYAF